LHSRASQALCEWIEDAVDTELTAIMRVASLRRAFGAINAIELLEQWSTQGQINHLKMLEQKMYAHPAPKLMRARMLEVICRIAFQKENPVAADRGSFRIQMAKQPPHTRTLPITAARTIRVSR